MAACLWCISPSVLAVTPATLIGPDLKAHPIEITTLDNHTLNYFDEERTLRSADIDRYVQLREIGDSETMDLSGMPGVWLTNGQRFSGSWVGPTDDGAGLQWRHNRIGTISIMLEDIAHVSWVPGDATDLRAAPNSDVITLINGDTLSGFVSALAGQGVTLVSESGDAPVTIPYGRIASMSLSNPKTQVIEPNHRLTLADGTRVQADRLEISGGLVSCRVFPPGELPNDIQMPIDELARIDFWAGGLRLIDLTELPIRARHKTYVFGLPAPLRLSGRSVRMHAPGEVAIELPDGSQRFAAVAELDTQDAPATMADWSDFEVIVSSEDHEPQRFRISGQQPMIRINTPATEPALNIRLDPGVNGPILDRLLLRDAVILVRTPGSEPSDDNGR